MSFDNLNLANSSLDVKCSGTIDFVNDLNLPNGKSIAELLEDQSNNEK